jgi:hypothetical protein
VIGLEDNYNDRVPEVAIDPQGRALIVWMGMDATSPDYEIYWSRWEEGTGWSSRQMLNPNNTQYDAWPRMSMAPDGTAWVAWLSRHQSEYVWDLLCSHWTSTGWSLPDTVVKGPGISDANYHGMAPVDSTHCWVVYDLSYQVCAREYQGDHWGPVEVVASGMAEDPYQVDVALGPDGQPWAAWTEDQVRASRRRADGTWEPSSLVNPGQYGATFQPAITVDASGEAWVVWNQDVECDALGRMDVFWSRTMAGVWQPMGVVNVLEVTDCGSDAAPDVAASYGFTPRAVWSRKYPGSAQPPEPYYDAYGSSWDSEAWNPQCRMHESDAVPVTDVYPTVAVGPQGEAWATWMRTGRTSPYYDIYVSQLLLDVIDLEVVRGSSGVEISWRLVGYAPREDFAFAVKRADEQGDTTWVCENIRGQGDEYFVVDEGVDPQARYTYWIEVLDRNERIDPPAGPLLFRTNARQIDLTVSVEEGTWGSRVPLVAVPNPSSGEVEFRFAGPRGAYALEVFDVQGRLRWRRAGLMSVGSDAWSAIRWVPRESGMSTGGVVWARLREKEGGVLATSKVVLIP